MVHGVCSLLATRGGALAVEQHVDLKCVPRIAEPVTLSRTRRGSWRGSVRTIARRSLCCSHRAPDPLAGPRATARLGPRHEPFGRHRMEGHDSIERLLVGPAYSALTQKGENGRSASWRSSMRTRSGWDSGSRRQSGELPPAPRRRASGIRRGPRGHPRSPVRAEISRVFSEGGERVVVMATTMMPATDRLNRRNISFSRSGRPRPAPAAPWCRSTAGCASRRWCRARSTASGSRGNAW